jgi:hypothetical protein
MPQGMKENLKRLGEEREYAGGETGTEGDLRCRRHSEYPNKPVVESTHDNVFRWMKHNGSGNFTWGRELVQLQQVHTAPHTNRAIQRDRAQLL